MSDDDVGDDPKVRSMRAVWLQMRDEDPPESGLAELLAAARTKADTLAHPSWWQRVSAMLRRPPVVALATVVILLGGALVIGRRIEPASTPAPPLEAKPSDEVTAGRAASTEHLPPAPMAPPARPAPTIDGPSARHETAAPPPPTPRFAEPPTLARPTTPPVAQGGQAEESLEVTADLKASAADAAAPSGQLAGRKEVDGLVAQCESAARRGDCAAVRALVERIEKSDRSYRARQAKDSPVGKCLAR